MDTVIRHCRPGELRTVISRLDGEFISGKGRSLSLGERFSHTLSPENAGRVLVAESGGSIRGALAVRFFDWAVAEQMFRGAMVGMVWVDPDRRGTGTGSRLLASAAEFMQENGADFGVLWTGVPAFYERAGWFASDRGLFGEASGHAGSPGAEGVSCRPLGAVDAAWLEGVRSWLIPARVVRTASDYRAVPIPADRVWCFSVGGDDGVEGFALAGEQDGTGYFYEMAAPPALWGPIWSAVTARFGRVLVNGCGDDPFAEWLAGNGLVAWQSQNKCMWLRVSGHIEEASVHAWHIPYFDWV